MRRGVVPACMICLICLTLCLPAQAELSPLAAKWREEGVQIEMRAELTQCAALSEGTLAIVQGWLNALSARLAARGSELSTTLLQNDEALLSVAVKVQDEYALTVFSPSGGAYLTTPEQGDALSLLAGGGAEAPNVSGWPAAYPALAEKLYPLLAEAVTPKASKTATSVKNALASAACENYVLTGEEMNRVWPDIRALLLPLLREGLSPSSAVYAQVRETLEAVTFSGECRFKRMLDKEGQDMGMQFTGRADVNGDTRKVTLFGGYTPGRGGYASLSLPAVKGKDNLKVYLTGRETDKSGVRTLTLEGGYTRTAAGETTAYTLDASLKNKIADGENLSGKITVTIQRPGQKKTTLTVTPALSGGAQGIGGTAALQWKTGTRVRAKATLHIALSPLEAWTLPTASAAKDLRGMTDEQARRVLAAEEAPLSDALLRLLSTLSEEQRAHLTHDLRTNEWMNGASVPPRTDDTASGTATSPESPWIVEEDVP